MDSDNLIIIHIGHELIIEMVIFKRIGNHHFFFVDVPIEKNLMHDTNKIQDVENQETYKAKFLSKSMETCFYGL